MPAFPPYGGPGWGSEWWGAGGWGGPTSAALQLVDAVAIRENVVQLTFNQPVYFSELLDIPDGSIISKYTVAPVAGSVGIDGNPARPVNVAAVALAQTPEDQGDLPPGSQFGAVLDVTLDRPMSPFPCAYTITVSQLFDADLSVALDPGHATLQYAAVFKVFVPPQISTPAFNRDFSNPQSLFGATNLPNPQNVANLGVFPISDGDYAIDSGLQGYKKRCFRRLYTAVAGFLHLGPTYGVGIPQQGKKLARPATIAQLAASAESQIGQEPETKSVHVTGARDTQNPGLTRFTVIAVTKGGASTKFSAAFPSST